MDKRDYIEAASVLGEMSSLLTEENWTKFDLAVDKDGYRTDLAGEAAAKWCLLGANLKIDRHNAGAVRILDSVLPDHTSYDDINTVSAFNDHASTNYASVRFYLGLALDIAKANARG